MPRLLLPLFAMSLLAIPAAAEEMNYFLKNDHSRAVVVELYSPARNIFWPGEGQVYLLEFGERKSVTIECFGGEKICYAAWVNGDDSVAWGIGPDGDLACEDCCSLCAQSATEDIIVGD
jgi:hypothetical protein